jgi:hypothetical protein
MDEFVFYRTVPLFLTYITTHTSSMNYWIITYSGLGSSVTVFPQIAIANSCRSCVEFTEQLKKRMCMELNESTLDKEFETGFKSVAEEFDKIGLHW